MEHKHRHTVEVGLTILSHASIPLKYWYGAFLDYVYLINHLAYKIIQNSTPFECLHSQKPYYSLLCTIRCACWPNLHLYNTKELQFRSEQCIFLVITIFVKATSV
jgi:hypothetical protein